MANEIFIKNLIWLYSKVKLLNNIIGKLYTKKDITLSSNKKIANDI